MRPWGTRRIRTLVLWLGVLVSIAGVPALAIEEPDYDLIRTYPEFELRRYAPYLVAETLVSGEFDEVGSTAFRILADYIFGNNRQREKIEMTAPVNQRPVDEGGEKIEMTAPVRQQAATPEGRQAGYLVSFVMPSRYTLDTLPQPIDARVHLREEPARLMAVRRYSGRWTLDNYRRNLATLREGMARAELKPRGEPVYARYNSPFALWFVRRNEVMIEVAEPD